MAEVFPDLPTVGSPNSTEQPKVRQSLIDLRDTINGDIDTDNLAAAAVTTVKIEDDAVTAAKVADSAIVDANVAAGAAIDGSKLAAASVSRDETGPWIQAHYVDITGNNGSITATWPESMPSALYVTTVTVALVLNGSATATVVSQSATTVDLLWDGAGSGAHRLFLQGIMLV